MSTNPSAANTAAGSASASNLANVAPSPTGKTVFEIERELRKFADQSWEWTKKNRDELRQHMKGSSWDEQDAKIKDIKDKLIYFQLNIRAIVSEKAALEFDNQFVRKEIKDRKSAIKAEILQDSIQNQSPQFMATTGYTEIVQAWIRENPRLVLLLYQDENTFKSALADLREEYRLFQESVQATIDAIYEEEDAMKSRLFSSAWAIAHNEFGEEMRKSLWELRTAVKGTRDDFQTHKVDYLDFADEVRERFTTGIDAKFEELVDSQKKDNVVPVKELDKRSESMKSLEADLEEFRERETEGANARKKLGDDVAKTSSENKKLQDALAARDANLQLKDGEIAEISTKLDQAQQSSRELSGKLDELKLEKKAVENQSLQVTSQMEIEKERADNALSRVGDLERDAQETAKLHNDKIASLNAEHNKAVTGIREESRSSLEKQRSGDADVLNAMINTKDRNHAQALQDLKEKLEREHNEAANGIREESRLSLEKQRSNDAGVMNATINEKDGNHAKALQTLREELKVEHAQALQHAKDEVKSQMKMEHEKAIEQMLTTAQTEKEEALELMKENHRDDSAKTKKEQEQAAKLIEERYEEESSKVKTECERKLEDAKSEHQKDMEAKEIKLAEAENQLAELKATKDKSAKRNKKRAESTLERVKSLVQLGTSLGQDQIDSMVNENFLQRFFTIVQSIPKLDASEMSDAQFIIPHIHFPCLIRESAEVTSWEAETYWMLAKSRKLMVSRHRDILVQGTQSETRLRNLPWVFATMQLLVLCFSAVASEHEFRIDRYVTKPDVLDLYLVLQSCAYIHETLRIWPRSQGQFDLDAQFAILSTAVTSGSPSVLEYSFVMRAMHEYVGGLLSGQRPTESWTSEVSSRGGTPVHEQQRCAVLNDSNSALPSGLCLVAEAFGLFLLITHQGSDDEEIFFLYERQFESIEHRVDMAIKEMTVTLHLGEVPGLPVEHRTLQIRNNPEQRRICGYWLKNFPERLPKYIAPEGSLAGDVGLP